MLDKEMEVKEQKEKRLIKVALIDDGVHSSMYPFFKQVNRWHVKKGIIDKETAEVTKVISHGTLCAAIIASKNTDIELLDIRVFENDGAEITDLITALEYCVSCGIQVINLSCGTLNYLDYKDVELTFKKLQRKNIIVVSAFSNQGILSFPAGCKNVFGVREDCDGYLKKGEYGFQKFKNSRLENSIVAHVDTVTIDNNDIKLTGNSFAAPVITAEIAKILKKNPNLHFRQIRRQLMLHSKSELCKGKEIKKSMYCSEKEINTPIIGIHRECCELKNFLKRRFMKDGYNVITVSEYVHCKTEIPCGYYIDNKKALNIDVIYTIDKIYSSDVIIFFLGRQRFETDNILDVVDIMISKKHNRIYLESGRDSFFCNKYANIYEYIIHFFSE